MFFISEVLLHSAQYVCAGAEDGVRVCGCPLQPQLVSRSYSLRLVYTSSPTIYRGNSLTRNNSLHGHYSRTSPMVLQRS